MKPRISVLTLGVTDLEKSVELYGGDYRKSKQRTFNRLNYHRIVLVEETFSVR